MAQKRLLLLVEDNPDDEEVTLRGLRKTDLSNCLIHGLPGWTNGFGLALSRRSIGRFAKRASAGSHFIGPQPPPSVGPGCSETHPCQRSDQPDAGGDINFVA